MARHGPGPRPDPAPTPTGGLDPGSELTDRGGAPAAAAPRVLVGAFWVWLLVVVLGIAETVVTYARADFTGTGSGSDPQGGHAALFAQAAIVSVVVALVWWVMETVAALALRRGRGWARVLLSVFGAITIVLNIVELLGAVPAATTGPGDVQIVLEVALLVLQAGAVVAALVLTYRPASRRYVARRPAN